MFLFLAALVVSAGSMGALPPVDLDAVCFVLAMAATKKSKMEAKQKEQNGSKTKIQSEKSNVIYDSLTHQKKKLAETRSPPAIRKSRPTAIPNFKKEG